jgi:dienelactone hydrolase
MFMRAERLLGIAVLGWHLQAQGTLADYQRAEGLRDKFSDLAVDAPDNTSWIGRSSRFIYRKSTGGGHQFVVFDAATLAKQPAFDHGRLAESLSKISGEHYKTDKLPFNTVTFVDDDKAVQYTAGDSIWKTNLSDYATSKVGPAPARRGNGVGRPPRPPISETFNKPIASPDGKWEALILNYNVFLREKGKKEAVPLSYDGSAGNYYELQSIGWSPDSKKIAAFRVRPGEHRMITLEESAPADQVQPKYVSIEYAKPGDTLDLPQPVLFHIADKKQFSIDDSFFPNPFALTRPVWWKDSRGFTFEYNERGHQAYRVIEVNAETGKPRDMIDEEAKTFFCYSGKKYRHDILDGKEVIWMSERDGWNHLYLYDGATGKVKNQITKGNWVVRGIEKVDDEHRQIWFRASGVRPGEDPYFNHYFRINFDGTGLMPLTEAEGNHNVTFSADMKYYVDQWSRVDMAPVSELHSASDGKKIGDLEHGNLEPLIKAGWRPPEPFHTAGRDGKAEIWGVIVRPGNFDPAKKYPVIENIYAGPQDSFVPKSFSPYNPMQSLAELGFIVVQIDGMGTSNRSKAFHDVCWKNLQDAGFPDRILWHKAVAAKYAYYDITRVGIYGMSAGGQNALGALLFHPEFYKVGIAASGCHDNRMDKIWWNEQWMGWPLGPQYIAASNVENAYRLRGKLLLTVGELDDNVDPASTYQVINALIKAKKAFDFLLLPGQRHTPGGPYGERKHYDFFVRHLLGVEPPDWNNETEQQVTAASDQ